MKVSRLQASVVVSNPCRYRPLTKKEEREIDPHKIKGRGRVSRKDLSVCTGPNCGDEGDIVEHRKIVHPGKDGKPEREKEVHYEPTGYNINGPEIKRKPKKPWKYGQSELIIEFIVMDFEDDPEDILKELGITSQVEFWKKGEPKVEGRAAKHTSNGFALQVNSRTKTFENRILDVLKPLALKWKELKELCEQYHAELSIGGYIVGDDIPPLFLSKEAITILSRLNAEVDFDLYFWPDEE